MPKIILTCHALGDGTGDLQHLIDICSFLKRDEKTKNHELVVVFTFEWAELESLFKKKLETLNIPVTHIYLSALKNHKEQFLSEPKLLEHLQTADQIIRVSSDYFVFAETSPFHAYINPQVSHKFIGEHERYETFAREITCCSLGLGPNCYGIKLSPVKKITSEKALDIFKKEDAQFYEDLLVKTGSSSAKIFSETHHLVPAFFNKFLPLYRLFLLCCINDTFVQGKNIAFYSSGSALSAIFSQTKLFDEPFLKESSIKEIQVIHREQEDKCKTIPINPNGKQIIYVLHGYKINDLSYQALYHQAEIGGVSGDNSFEMGLSSQFITYYHSTNANTKKATLVTLKNIIEKKIPLAENVKKDFLIFFANLPDWNSIIDRYNDEKEELAAIAKQYAKLDFRAMLQAWPIVISYLDKNYNFYRQLPAIINNESVVSNKKTFDSTPNITTPALPRASQVQASFFADDIKSAPVINSPAASEKKNT